MARDSDRSQNDRQRSPRRGRTLDPLDRAILHSLCEDASVSVARIAEQVGCPNATCHLRIGRLQQQGYIEKYTIVLGKGRLRFSEFNYVLIGLKNQNRENVDLFREFLADIKEVVMWDWITGDFDFIAKIGFDSGSTWRQVHDKINSHLLCRDLRTLGGCLSGLKELRFDIDQLV